MSVNLEIQQWPQNWKRSVFIPYQRRAMPNNVQTTIQLPSFHMLARYCSKSFKLGFSSIWNKNFQMYKVGLKKAEEPEIRLPTVTGSRRKQGGSRKASTSSPLIMLKPLTMWITINCGKFLKRWEYQAILPAFWKTCMQVKKQQLELDTEQQTCSKLGKAIYCHPAHLTPMHSTSYEMPGWMKHKLESRFLGEISTP